MGEFWNWGNYVSWEHCIEANRLCNIQICPDTMNCCVSNCIGIPTIKGVVSILSITILIMFFIWIFNVIKTADKIAKRDGELKDNAP